MQEAYGFTEGRVAVPTRRRAVTGGHEGYGSTGGRPVG
jgi:hypothetical protein